MYYRKNSGMTLTVPKNYGGNAFRSESDDEQNYRIDPTEPPTDKVEKKCKTESSNDILTSLISGISAEDMLLLGLIFIIYQENPNDSALILLLILLLAK